MIRRLCILTKSYKQGGYCVVGLDLATKQYIRLINGNDCTNNAIEKFQMYVDGKDIGFLDVIEVNVIEHAPTSCQIENWIIAPDFKWKYIQTLSLKGLLQHLPIDYSKYFILDKHKYLTNENISEIDKSFFVYFVSNLNIISREDNYDEGIVHKHKCSFTYNKKEYNDISLTDPEYRVEEVNGLVIDHALIFASLPCIPFKDDFYYKFIAKIVPLEGDMEILNNFLDEKELNQYILSSIVKGKNPFNGESITGIDENLQNAICKIIDKLNLYKEAVNNPNKLCIDSECVVNKNLLKELKQKRNEIANEKDLPGYCIFTNSALENLAYFKPTNEEDFIIIKGLGRKTYKQYGQEMIEIIKKYL